MIKTTATGHIATVTLSRPERHNSLVPELLEDLLAAFGDVGNDARVVVLTAEGRSFSTGGDVRAFFDAAEPERYAREVVGLLNRAMLAMMRLPQPIVTAVHGIVTGGSLGLLLASDVVLVSPGVTITPWYSEVGFSPDGGWTALLPDLIGEKRTALILLRNESITAEETVDWGLASDVLPAETIRDRAVTLASEIAAMKQGSTASIKRLLSRDVDVIAARLEDERSAFVQQFLTAEARAGMAAFLGEAV
ncbi:MAG: enoyl-CoA hydratase/isomerase family protein [Acidimicrobiia bacterium]